jgi:hypothetical protein
VRCSDSIDASAPSAAQPCLHSMEAEREKRKYVKISQFDTLLHTEWASNESIQPCTHELDFVDSYVFLNE